MLATPRFCGFLGHFAVLNPIIPLNSQGGRSRGSAPAPQRWLRPLRTRPTTRVQATKVAAEQTIVSGMAGRYATALFELAREGGAIDHVKADLDRFDALMAESPDLLRLVRSPVFSADEQRQALSAGLQRAGIGGGGGEVFVLGGEERPAVSGGG